MDNQDNQLNQENSEINSLSMELLVNKSQYNKILFKLNPSKFKERQKYYDNINQYKTKIQSIFTTLLDEPNKTITREINSSFDSFILTCIKHLEISKIHETREFGNERDEGKDDDVLFDNDNMFDGSKMNHSLWGEQIKKEKYSYLE